LHLDQVVEAHVYEYLVTQIDGHEFMFALVKPPDRTCYNLVEYSTGKAVIDYFLGARGIGRVDPEKWMQQAVDECIAKWGESDVASAIFNQQFEAILNETDF